MKRILILCNGRPPGRHLFSECRAKADYFIAADGGGNVAREFESHPDVVIGDLDSYKSQGEEPFEVIHQAEQESNDLEKALRHALKNNGTHVQILGATGRRLDHTLKNLSVLKQFDSQFDDLYFNDEFGETRLLQKSFEADLPIGTDLSLFPLSGKVTGISTSGLKYPLADESLENGVRDGSSNRVSGSPVQIEHKTGDLLLFIAR